jgi:uncharacterized protein (DUF2147 family)
MGTRVKRAKYAALLVLSAIPVSAAHTEAIEGHWANPKHSTVVNVSRCGPGYCAIVLKASTKAQANARKGGTHNFIGTEILNVRPAGDGTYKGKAFDPETNWHVPATVTFVRPDVIEIKGCVFAGMFCKAQRWTKVS